MSEEEGRDFQDLANMATQYPGETQDEAGGLDNLPDETSALRVLETQVPDSSFSNDGPQSPPAFEPEDLANLSPQSLHDEEPPPRLRSPPPPESPVETPAEHANSVDAIVGSVFGDEEVSVEIEREKRKKKSKKSKKSRKEKRKHNNGEENAPKRRKRGGKGDVAPGDEEDRDVPSRPAKPINAFEAALEKVKMSKKRVQLTEEQVKQLSSDLIRRMEIATAADREANRRKQPALNKRVLIKEVADMFAKTSVVDQIVTDGGLLRLAAWLKPLPDGSLPNLDVRTEILQILSKVN